MVDQPEPTPHFAAAQPDAFDRAYGQAQGFSKTGPSTITIANVMGIGGVRQFTVETFRIPELGDMVFVTIAGPEGLQRVHIPAPVSNIIARHRDALSAKSRRAGAKQAYKTRVAAGDDPAKNLVVRKAGKAKHK